MTKTRELSVSARLEQNKKKAWEYLSKIVGTPTAGGRAASSRAGARLGYERAAPARRRGPEYLLLLRRGLEPRPQSGGAGDPAPGQRELRRRRGRLLRVRRGYFEVRGKQRPFNLREARRPWTLVGRKYRNVKDQGHVAIVLPGGKLLESYDAGGGRPGVNTNVSLERSDRIYFYDRARSVIHMRGRLQVPFKPL